ncbi:hypothetical protein PR048_022030 [Dryococelus australis]|uniref:Uncharacterized protein n=1 Tax=Dryococelus australis TaxID=614101 RepID=A0ABQ9GZW5_9NEOP|nr:hypothetical protein PR048_022030 [Dryococelus australis]
MECAQRRNGAAVPFMHAYAFAGWPLEALEAGLTSDWPLRAAKHPLFVELPACKRAAPRSTTSAAATAVYTRRKAQGEIRTSNASSNRKRQFKSAIDQDRHVRGGMNETASEDIGALSEETWTALNIEVLQADEVGIEQRRNERAGETGDPQENPLTNGFVGHDSHMRKSGVTRLGIEPGSPWWEASRLNAQPPTQPGCSRRPTSSISKAQHAAAVVQLWPRRGVPRVKSSLVDCGFTFSRPGWGMAALHYSACTWPAQLQAGVHATELRVAGSLPSPIHCCLRQSLQSGENLHYFIYTEYRCDSSEAAGSHVTRYLEYRTFRNGDIFGKQCNGYMTERFFFKAATPRKTVDDNCDAATHIKCVIAAKRKALNWHAVFSSCSSTGMKGLGKLEIPEKTRLRDPTCENTGVTRPGIKPGGEQFNRSATKAKAYLECVVRKLDVLTNTALTCALAENPTSRVCKQRPRTMTETKWRYVHVLFDMCTRVASVANHSGDRQKHPPGKDAELVLTSDPATTMISSILRHVRGERVRSEYSLSWPCHRCHLLKAIHGQPLVKWGTMLTVSWMTFIYVPRSWVECPRRSVPPPVTVSRRASCELENCRLCRKAIAEESSSHTTTANVTNTYFSCLTERGGAMVTHRTRNREDPGSIPGPAILISAFRNHSRRMLGRAPNKGHGRFLPNHSPTPLACATYTVPNDLYWDRSSSVARTPNNEAAEAQWLENPIGGPQLVRG